MSVAYLRFMKVHKLHIGEKRPEASINDSIFYVCVDMCVCFSCVQLFCL